MKPKKEKENQVNEQISNYGSSMRRISFDQTLENMEASQYDYWIGLSPEQRIGLSIELTKSLFGEIKKSGNPRRIIFGS